MKMPLNAYTNEHHQDGCQWSNPSKWPQRQHRRKEATVDSKENADGRRGRIIPCSGPRITNGETVDVLKEDILPGHFLVLLDPQLRIGGVLLGREDEFGLCLFCSSTICRSSSTIASWMAASSLAFILRPLVKSKRPSKDSRLPIDTSLWRHK